MNSQPETNSLQQQMVHGKKLGKLEPELTYIAEPMA